MYNTHIDKDSCAARVQSACEQRLNTIRILLGEFTADDITIKDDGTSDTIVCVENVEVRYDQEFIADYRDNKGALNIESLAGDIVADFWSQLHERLGEYCLAFDYVEPNTFVDQTEAYFRYQISCGGPSEEIRFYTNPDFSMHRAEFWFLNWFDGAHIDVSDDQTVKSLWREFAGCETPKYVFEESSR